MNNKTKDCCGNCKRGNTEECDDYGGFAFHTIFDEEGDLQNYSVIREEVTLEEALDKYEDYITDDEKNKLNKLIDNKDNKMKDLIKKIIGFGRQSNGRMLLVGALFLLIVAFPFILGIIVIATQIENEVTYMTLSAIVFLLFIITFIFTTKALNKL